MSAPQLKQPIKGSKVWYVCWSDGRRSKRVSTGTDSLAAAQVFFAQWLLMERQAPANDAGFKVSDLWALYRAKHVEKNVASPDTADYSWKNLEPHFGALTLAQIDQDCVDAYEKKRAAGKIGRKSNSGTVRRELITLRACLNWCAAPKRKVIEPSSLPAFDLPADSAPRDRWLRIEEVQKLLKAAAELRRGDRLSRGERFLWLALETAARKEAILELTWDRVDFETGVIHYNVPGRKLTKKRRAAPPMSAPLRTVLERAYKERVSDLVMDNGAEIWKTIRLIADKAGVADVSPHVLRHTAATLMARNGVSLWDVASVLGNSMQVVQKVYAKVRPDGLVRAVNSISSGALELPKSCAKIAPEVTDNGQH